MRGRDPDRAVGLATAGSGGELRSASSRGGAGEQRESRARRKETGSTMRATVLEVLAERRAHGSTPGARKDDHRVALVIEGGGSRAAYSTGMIGVIHERGLAECFDAVYGSSAGALNGAWLLCGRAPEAMAGWTAPGVMRKVMDSRRVVRGRPVVDLDFLINVLYTPTYCRSTSPPYWPTRSACTRSAPTRRTAAPLIWPH